MVKERILRICRKKKIRSIIKHRYNCCTKPASDPAYIAENVLNKEFQQKIVNAGMPQSMSRVAHCIDNEPMEYHEMKLLKTA